MLEFIVLGQIPGTGFVITFTWFIALVAVASSAGLVRYQHRHHLSDDQSLIEEISL